MPSVETNAPVEAEINVTTEAPVEVEINVTTETPVINVQIGGGGSGSGGMTDAVKQALMDVVNHIGAWSDEHGAEYAQALYDALYPPKTLVIITAVFEQGSTVVYDSASLDSLKSMLTVTARYDDNTTDILADSDYALSGVLEAGTSTVTATYNGKTDTFTVNVTAVPTLSSISAAYTQSGTVYDTDTLDSLKTDLVVTANYSDSSTQPVAATDYTLSGTLSEGISTITVSYTSGSITKTATFNVTVEKAPSLDVLITKSIQQSCVYSDGGETSLSSQNSSTVYVSEETFPVDTLLEITVLYGINNANLKQYAGSWDGDTSAYRGLYGEIIGSAKTTAYTAQYTVKAGHKLLIKNYNSGTPQSITAQRVVS
jgi:hypothetical protein